MYTATLYTPKGYRADTDSVYFHRRIIGKFHSEQEAQQAAATALLDIDAGDLQPYVHCRIKPDAKHKRLPIVIKTFRPTPAGREKLAQIKQTLNPNPTQP